MPLILLTIALWVLLGIVGRAFPAAAGSLVGAGVGGTVSVTIYLVTRAQAKRQSTIELFKEYYSAEFAGQRRAAETFMATHAATDWSSTDPYAIGRNDPDLAGYGALLRFWQRVAVLHREGELSTRLVQRLLSRELGYWNALVFLPMAARKGMYVRPTIAELARLFSIGEGRDAFEDGGRDAETAAASRRSSNAPVAAPAPAAPPA